MGRIIVATPGTITEEKVPFTFSSGTLTLQSVQQGSVITGAWINITTPFNVPGALIQLGTTAYPGLVFSSGEVNPLIATKYGAPELIEFAVADFLLLAVTAVGATQGAGVLVYQYRR